MMLNDQELRTRISAMPWFHSVEIRKGLFTPGSKSPALMQQEYDLTFDKLNLGGRSVLDVGAWSGAFSVEACRRGAKAVTALDHFTWTHPVFKGREAFDLVVNETGAKIDAVEVDLDAPRLDLTSLGTFDVVLFLGVFYHLKDPLAALRELSLITKEVLVLESYVDLTMAVEPPRMTFFPGKELGNDATNWWGPNVSCLKSLLTMNGFKRVEVSQGAIPNRMFFHAYISG